MKRDKNKNPELNNNDEKFVKVKVKHDHTKLKVVISLLLFITVFLAIYIGIIISRWQNLALDIIENTPSQIIDNQGKLITEIGSTKISKNIPLSTIPENLKDAYISIEDQRFYSHSGVDIPRTAAAIINYVKNLGKSSFGGSSITQQLVKNITGENTSSITRKIKEWCRAITLEYVLEKDEILEAYFNIIYVGPNIYGVEMGSKYYFNKECKNLSLEECAFLAGINNAPNSYSPFDEKDNSEKIKTRTKAVLYKMNELGYITKEEYETAKSNVDKGLAFSKGNISSNARNNNYSYHTDALLTEVINDISNKKSISKEFATNYIEMAGLTIYSAQDTKIQNHIENEFKKSTYSIKSKNDPNVSAQAAMVIIDHTTGQVKGCVGGIGNKVARGFNRATQAYRQTGSASKPIAVLLPAIDKKIITGSSIYKDEIAFFEDGTDEGYSPENYNNYLGDITIRRAVESSQNIPFVKVMEQITPRVSINYMKKLGISSLTDVDNNINLALGGLDKGITPLELAAAYSTIANDGNYIEPSFYIKVENRLAKTVVKPNQKKYKAFSKEVAFIIQDLLREPVIGSHGTATYCKIKNIDVAAKTGTTNNEYDRWLCGFTPYYTAVTWFGFDVNETIDFNKKNPSGLIWSNVMKSIHTGLDGKIFDKPYRVETAQVCKHSGLLASTECNETYTEYYLRNTVPKQTCVNHKAIVVDTPITREDGFEQ